MLAVQGMLRDQPLAQLAEEEEVRMWAREA